MKLPVTQKIVEQVLREAHENNRLQCGSWAVENLEPGRFAGCAVGNILHAASGTFNPSIINSAATRVIRGATPDWDEASAFDDAYIRRWLKRGNMLGAISCIFESTYDGSSASLERTLAAIRKRLPARFSIDIDGLRAMPTWRKKKAKRGKS